MPIFLRLIYRGIKQPTYWQRIPERFGFVPSHIDSNDLWIHAVSVGEVRAAVILIKELKKVDPRISFFVTTTTPTGSAQLIRELDNSIEHMYLPYDLGLFYREIFKRVNPKMLVIMETEIWPNLIHKAKQNNVKIVLANARLSKKSARGYARLNRLFKPILNQFDAVLAQQRQDAMRFKKLGAKQSCTQVVGNIKFDQEPINQNPELTAELQQAWGGNKTLIALASSHPKEEALLLSQLKENRYLENILLIIIPRHPERFKEVIKLSEQMGFITAKRSNMLELNQQTQVFIGDSMGEMIALLSACDLVIMGGSLLTKGGHNPIEPAALAKPILMGRHYHNFQKIGDMLLKAEGMKVVEPEKTLDAALEILNLNQGAKMGQCAQEVVKKNIGAASLMSQAILKLTHHQP